jgi:ParB-like chromosome segregation protein Spo0J
MSEGVNNDTPATAGEAEAAAGVTPPVVVEQQEQQVPPPPPSAPPLPQVEETPVIHKHFVAPALIPLDRVDDEGEFRVRDAAELEDEAIAPLATDIARLGQLFPIDVRLRPPDRFQVITGFRRVSALRFLQREKVLARLHTDLSDADAMLMSLASAIHSRNVGPEALTVLRAALEESGRLSPSARDMLDKALSSGDDLAPEQVEEEVDADELAADVTVRLGQANQDLSLLADVFGELDETRREELLKQLRYSSELVAFLESKQ